MSPDSGETGPRAEREDRFLYTTQSAFPVGTERRGVTERRRIEVEEPGLARPEVALGILADLLDAVPGDAVVTHGFSNPHSWRGIYAEAAFERAENVQVSAMRADVERALTKVFEGWKGGDYSYGRYTPAHLSTEGSSVEYDWTPLIKALTAAAEQTW